MKRNWSIEEKLAILKEAETLGIVETCRKHGLYATTYYSWKKKYDTSGEEGLRPGYSKREHKDLNRLVKENERLKKMLAEKDLELGIKTELLKKRWNSGRAESDNPQVCFQGDEGYNSDKDRGYE